MDALCSAVPPQINADLQFTLMAGTLAPHWGAVSGAGTIASARASCSSVSSTPASARTRIREDSIEVRLDLRAHNPLLIAAGFRAERPVIPWLGGKQLRLVIGLEDPKSSHSET